MNFLNRYNPTGASFQQFHPFSDHEAILDISSALNSAQALQLINDLIIQPEFSQWVRLGGYHIHLNAGPLFLTAKVIAKINTLLKQYGTLLHTVYATLPQTQQGALDSGFYVKEAPKYIAPITLDQTVAPRLTDTEEALAELFGRKPRSESPLPTRNMPPALGVSSSFGPMVPATDGLSLPFEQDFAPRSLPSEWLDDPIFTSLTREVVPQKKPSNPNQGSEAFAPEPVISPTFQPSVVPPKTLREKLEAQPILQEVTVPQEYDTSADINASMVLGHSTMSSAPKSRFDGPFEPDAIELAMPTYYYPQTLRSGQVIRYDGHLVIVGDVHSGSEVSAAGSILVWGELKGIAHAGARGDETAEIRAMNIEAVQIRIGQTIARRPDRVSYHKTTSSSSSIKPEIARIVDGEIQIYKELVN